MKIKKDLMFGTVFLLLMVASIFFIELAFIPSVNASFSNDWRVYGESFTPLWNQQLTGTTGIFNTTNVLTSTIAVGMTPYASVNQPLVTTLNSTYGTSFNEYIIFPNGNYIEIYDKNLVLSSEVLVGGSAVSQLHINDFNNNGVFDDILGVYNISGVYSFRDYNYNISTGGWNLSYQYNFTGSDVYFGLRGDSRNVYLIRGNSSTKDIIMTIINTTNGNLTVTDVSLTNINTLSAGIGYKEPLGWIDMNADGNTEFLLFNSNYVLVYDKSGNLVFNITNNTGDILDAKMFKADPTNQWRIAVLYKSGTITPFEFKLKAYKLDGTILWSNTYSETFAQSLGGAIAVIDDYDGDLANVDNELYLFTDWFRSAVGYTQRYRVIKGNTGASLTNAVSPTVSGTSTGGLASLVIADMNNNGKKDFIVSFASNDKSFAIFDPFTADYIINNSDSGTQKSCVPADVNLDGYLEIVCSRASLTQVYSVNYTNQNAVLNSIIYDPSLVFPITTTLYANINAGDFEGDQIVYAIKCANNLSWIEGSSPTQSCYYGSVGVYNVSVGVRDIYHSTYSSVLSSTVTVTSTANLCNFNSICESNLGENSYNCPSDCPFANNTQSASETGGIPIPSELVSTTNINQGLLPEIYFGTLGFLSNTLQPMIILIFMIFFVLIIVAIAYIFRSIANKVGDIGR